MFGFKVSLGFPLSSKILLSIPIPDSFQGESLLPLIKGSQPSSLERYAFSASSVVQPENIIRLHSIQNSRWKLIYDTVKSKFQLYDLKKDPQEKNNVSEENPKTVLELSKRLFEHLEKSEPDSIP